MKAEPLPAMGTLLLGSVSTLARRGLGLQARLDDEFRADALSSAHLAAYGEFFGGFAGSVPLTALYPLAQRAQLALMLGGEFPYAVPGMVHVSNTLTALRAVDGTAGYDLAVSVTPPAEAPAGAGVRLAFEVALSQGGQTCVTCHSVYLARRGTPGRSGERSAAQPAPEAHAEAWWLAADEGRRYAKLSGDYNPIHLSAWLSRFFGFKQPIMHGMDAVARALSAIERQAGRPVTAIEVAFKRPIFLPAEVRLAWGAEGRFVVESADGQTRHVEGQYSL